MISLTESESPDANTLKRAQIMIFTEYKNLIEFISSCNGTGKKELQKRVDNGELSGDEADYVFLYACMHKINAQLDDINDKLDAAD